MSDSPPDLAPLQYIITHVFCPLQLPDGDDHSAPNDCALAAAVTAAARHYSGHVDEAIMPQWYSISRMLENLQSTIEPKSLGEAQTLSQLTSMENGDTLAFLVRAQNAAVLFRKHTDTTIFESFEVSPKAEDVVTTPGKLIRSYPGPAIEIPNAKFEDKIFLLQLANFLARMNNDILDAAPTSQKAGSTVVEPRDTIHPRYITELLTGILRSVGRPADVVRITKRMGDDVMWNNSNLPWRRSSLWLLIRVAIQTSLYRSSPHTYKHFMLFLMCRLANDKLVADLSNDFLECMLAKISRRLRKLGPSAPDELSCVVLQTSTCLRSILEKRWYDVQAAQRASPPWNPSQLDLDADVNLSLLTSGDYIRNSLVNCVSSPVNTPFSPKHHYRGSLEDFLSAHGTFEEAYAAEPYVALYDVERAVEQEIDAWVDCVTDRDEACENLETLAGEYSNGAQETYSNNPELLSIMLLTTIELWIALDKLAILETPMLAEYSPEVPISFLERLLLSKSGNLLRVKRAYNYLSGRHARYHSGWSIFSPSITVNSFAIRFYRTSSRLQNLKSTIEKAAQSDVRKKISELKTENARHAELKQRAAQLDHEYGISWRGRRYHDRNCKKCSLESQYQGMRITIQEWPLPAEQLRAEAVTFELACPVAFNMWRSATFRLLVDICSPPVEPNEPYILLPDYGALQPHLVKHPRSRVTLASGAKPFVATHYSGVSIPTTQDRVCLNNGLDFHGFDSHAKTPLPAVSGPYDISRYCTYKLQSKLYQELQKYVATTSHTSNDVMANQADCHQDISIHEYISFGHLRSGDLLQWLNILRELRGRSLTFRRCDVHFLFAQAASQVGPLEDSDAGWRWHHDIQQLPFCEALIGELKDLVQDVGANWLEAVTMDTVSFLLRRLLASCPGEMISSETLGLLQTVRSKVFSWVEELSAKLKQTPEDEELRGFLRDAAAICRSTFHVDPSVGPLLLDSPNAIATLIFCAILVHDHTPSQISSLPVYSRLLLDRDRRLSLTLESVVSDVIQADSSDEGIDLAIGWVWPGFRPGSKWRPLQSPNSRWFWCDTASTTGQSSQKVHFNVLDGSLLVDGKPLGRLPSDILQHPHYKLIFGKDVLDVIPSDLPGMDYSTRGTISGHQVYFSLRNNSNLVIKAKHVSVPTSDAIMELIPSQVLTGDIPVVLIEEHVHWLNLSTYIMDIRPLSSLWTASSENWKMYCTLGQYCLQKGDERLVDIRSPSWDMVSRLLKPLDAPENLLVCVSQIKSSSSMQLSVSLPRYASGLSFFVDEDGDLQSRNMRDMVYDEDQSIGTWLGLVNRLVLRSKRQNIYTVESIPRRILVPYSKISYRKDGHHVFVHVQSPDSALTDLTYQTYTVDIDLGCLTGNVSIENKLYGIYLHALTSGCGPDPLTGRTGTEEALSLLRSAGCSSIMRFSPHEAELLGLIASICPKRTWYPEHRRCMQTVEWNDLPTSSQHHELYGASKAIKEHFEKVQPFLENQSSSLFQEFPERNSDLLKRSVLRAAYLFPFEYSGHPLEGDHDVWYSSRDLLIASDAGEQRAYVAATSVHERTAYSMARNDILSMMESWKRSISGTRTTSLSLKYDRSWLVPDLPLIWLKAYSLLRGGDDDKWFQLLFSVPAMAYASPKLSDLVPIFIAFARDPRFLQEDPPPHESYDLADTWRPSEDQLRGHILSHALSFEDSPESSLPARRDESDCELRERRLEQYSDRRESDANETIRILMNAWPCETPPLCRLGSRQYHVSTLTSDIRKLFASCYHNLKLKEHLNRVQVILKRIYAQSSPFPTPPSLYSFESSQTLPPHGSCQWSITSDELFARLAAPPSLPELAGPLEASCSPGDKKVSLSNSTPLDRLLDLVEANGATDTFQRKYVSNLRTSGTYFRTDNAPMLEEYYVRCMDSYVNGLNDVKRHFTPRNQSEQALAKSGQWPRITAHALFRSLASNSPIALSYEWRKCLVQLTLLALGLQRARRLLRLHRDNLQDELLRELQNKGCDGWDAEAHPDWLLIQLQSNLLVRRVQAEVAKEMIAPRSGDNTAMQLNMGEGKSSVIVPIVVASLADGTQLVRVIVPKALTAQMFNILVDRLGGLVNRRIYFLPFSRSLGVDDEKATALQNKLAECMARGGILVVQPEHILSLKLVSVEKQLKNEEQASLGRKLLEIQKWLHSHSRDILDESDEILHVRYQLVYTIGEQKVMEGSSERWTTTEQVLALVCKHASSLHKRFPLGVDYQEGSPSGCFPHLRILHADAGQQLISWIAQDVLDGRLHNLNLGQLCPAYRDAIESFISCENAPPAKVQLVKDYCRRTPLWSGLLLLRGLFGTGILLYALRELRWRVDFGLAPDRTMLAVPFRAKDVPAQRAEFGHPDVAILLTCLSYYYGGLTEKQLMLSFEMLLKQDAPSLEYRLWIENRPDMPDYLLTLNGVNIKSQEQWKNHLYPLFHKNRVTVDFYLSNVVFPKKAKEFPSKLSCSGWDLAEKKERLLTGFSGTNDGKYLLPLHIEQRDPDHQRGTNAKVLSYILRPENGQYLCMANENGERQSTHEFLKILADQQPEIQVLLDVGAQMLDLENRALAKTWLDNSTAASAAIYFNKHDELMVLTRDGSKQLFISSPFAQRLDECVVYLDDAHTRGTDIKFPSGFRAAVTLGPKVTKDRLAQGCMRMRKLGHGHSLVFFAPLEIDRRIRAVARKGPQDVIGAVDILQWAIRETCDDIQQRAPHWAQQGMDHRSRYSTWTKFCRDMLTSDELSRAWLQREAKTLEELYCPHASISLNTSLLAHPDIREHCVKLGILSLRDVSMDEEQEREVAHEIEREQRVERPPKLPPAVHRVHPEVMAFVEAGFIPQMSTAFHPVMETLDITSAAAIEPQIWSRHVLATADFAKTVIALLMDEVDDWSIESVIALDEADDSPAETVTALDGVDDYLRPVMWLASGKSGDHEVLVILSPFEVNELLPYIRSSDKVHLHLYTPRVTKSMKPCDDLSLYSIPTVPDGWSPSPSLMDQLNVFAGQLYLKDYGTYIRLCRFLCVYARDLEDEEDLKVGCDGFISPNTRPKHLASVYTFQTSPVASVKALTGLRRKGMGFAKTDMGKLLDGRLLDEEDFKR